MSRSECDVHHPAHVHSDWLHLAHQRPSLSSPPGQGAQGSVAWLRAGEEVRGGGGQYRHVRGHQSTQSRPREQQPEQPEDGLV